MNHQTNGSPKKLSSALFLTPLLQRTHSSNRTTSSPSTPISTSNSFSTSSPGVFPSPLGLNNYSPLPNSNSSSPNTSSSFAESKKRPRKELDFFKDDRYKDYDRKTTKTDENSENSPVEWRNKQRKRTLNAALVLCLHIGVDPPDVIKVQPCAKLECWKDPLSLPQNKALEMIGNTLEEQYKRLQPNAKYFHCLAPTVEEIQRTCCKLRKNAHGERVLFHYNGHGVPRPTVNGELWGFNRDFTQYIPFSLFDLHQWLQSPSVYVFDCSHAGLCVKSLVDCFDQDTRGASKQNFILAASSENELLPSNPHFPADLFTSCLTTPINVALQWFLLNNRLLRNIQNDIVTKIPGALNDKRSPLGELNWIFTTVADSIAWNVLPRDLFHTLFRQDVMVAGLFRNFLLADRIMRSLNCTPQSYPKLPSATHNHPLWQAWDLALDLVVAQVPKILANPHIPYQNSTFFSAQLTEFDVWLTVGARKKTFPKQLPVLLQVLLTGAHRLTALKLLSRFLDMGPWAVNLALSVGIVPYVLKSLLIDSAELRHTLVFIWAKILAVDRSCQRELVTDNGHIYFINILDNTSNESNLRSMAAFVLSAIADKFQSGQTACFRYKDVLKACMNQLAEPNANLKKWLLLLIAKILADFDEAQQYAFKIGLHEKIIGLLNDVEPAVRASAVYTLHHFISTAGVESQKGNDARVKSELSIGVALFKVISDGNPLVRRELLFAFSTFLRAFTPFISQPLLRKLLIDTGEIPASSGDQLSPSLQTAEPLNPARIRMMSLNSDLYNQNEEGGGITKSSSMNFNSATTPTKLGRRTMFTLDISRIILMLSDEPVSDVSKTARNLLSYIKRKFLGIKSPVPTPAPATTASFIQKSGGAPSLANMLMGAPQPQVVDSDHNEENTEDDDEDSSVKVEEDDSLKSSFYEFTVEQFTRPMLPETLEDDDEEQAAAANLVMRKEKRREKLIKESIMLSEAAGKKRLEEQVGFFGNEVDIVTKIKFHPTETSLVSADEKDGISVWNWLHNKKIHGFRLGNDKALPDGRITDLNIINEVHNPLLMIATDCGNVLFYKDFQTSEKLVSALHAVPEATISHTPSSNPAPSVSTATTVSTSASFSAKQSQVPVTPVVQPQQAGILTQWQSNYNLLYVAGEMKHVKIWDLEKETCIQSIPVDFLEPSTSASVANLQPVGITSMSCVNDVNSFVMGGSNSHILSPFLVACGCSDGTIFLMDRRVPMTSSNAAHSVVFRHKDQSRYIVNTHLQKVNPYQLITGSASGEVKFWDLRNSSNISVINKIEQHKFNTTAMAVHNYAPIIASGSNNQLVKVFNYSGETLGTIYYHDGFLGQRIGPVSCLEFHPYKLCLAAGATDSIVSVYTSDIQIIKKMKKK